MTLRPFYKRVAGFITCVLLCGQIFTASAQAALVSTAQSVQHIESEATRARLMVMLDRDDICQQLSRWGVDPEEARARVNTLTESELAAMADQIESLPAGGGALTLAIVSALIVFLVLLYTDIAGYTDVFPFVR